MPDMYMLKNSKHRAHDLTMTKRSFALRSVAIQWPPAAAVVPAASPSLMLPLLPLPPSLLGLLLL
jgi:hypothetical protein